MFDIAYSLQLRKVSIYDCDRVFLEPNMISIFQFLSFHCFMFLWVFFITSATSSESKCNFARALTGDGTYDIVVASLAASLDGTVTVLSYVSSIAETSEGQLDWTDYDEALTLDSKE